MRVGITTSSFGQADPVPLTRLREGGVEVTPNPYGRRLSAEEAFEFVRDLDGLIAGLEPLNRRVLGNARSLRAIARVGIGLDNVDLDAAAEFGISVSRTPEPPTIAVAEMTMAALLSVLRRFPEATSSMRRGEWQKEIQSSLHGSRALIVGFGRIGRRVASFLKAFGAICLATDPHLEEADVPDWVELVDLDAGLVTADIVTIHASGSEPIVKAPELANTKHGVVLLNASRGRLVDEAALLNGLETGQVGAAWFDAFWEEPYSGPLLSHPRFYATPHVATYTRQCRRDMELEAVANLLRDLGSR